MKLLSWNIQWGRGADGVVDLQRTIAAIRTLGEFDVLCLQEVSVGFAGLHDDRRPVDEVAVLAAAFPGYSAHFAAGVDVPDGAGGRSRFGNLTLSRLPQVGRLSDNIYYSQGCSGHGITYTHLIGRVLSEAIRGQAERFSAFEQLPHYPFPGGRAFRVPFTAMGAWWYNLRDKLGI